MAINLLNELDYLKCCNTKCNSKLFYEDEYFTLEIDKDNKDYSNVYIKTNERKQIKCIKCNTIQDNILLRKE